jgi:hypothetical protein
MSLAQRRPQYDKLSRACVKALLGPQAERNTSDGSRREGSATEWSR